MSYRSRVYIIDSHRGVSLYYPLTLTSGVGAFRGLFNLFFYKNMKTKLLTEMVVQAKAFNTRCGDRLMT